MAAHGTMCWKQCLFPTLAVRLHGSPFRVVAAHAALVLLSPSPPLHVSPIWIACIVYLYAPTIEKRAPIYLYRECSRACVCACVWVAVCELLAFLTGELQWAGLMRLMRQGRSHSPIVVSSTYTVQLEIIGLALQYSHISTRRVFRTFENSPHVKETPRWPGRYGQAPESLGR